MVTDFAVLLHEKLSMRKKGLLSNAAMICAVYLDPRVRMDLTDDQIFIAKSHLVELYGKVQRFRKSISTNDQEDTTFNRSVENEKEDSFNTFMAKKASAKNPTVQQETAPVTEIDVSDSLVRFEKATPYHQVPVLEFWETQKNLFPQLYELASIINSIPPTQATVERYFSMLNFVYNCRRYNLGSKMLQNILTVKLNVDIARHINERELHQLENQ